MTIQTTICDVHSPKKFITAYGKKLKISLKCTGPGRTKQSFKAECDINQIMARFRKTGTVDFTNKHEPRYGDVTAFEYQSAVCTVAAAKSMFNDMPSHLRARFENEPARFLAFVNDERNRAEAEQLGLLKVKPEGPVASPQAPQANPTAPAASSPPA